MRGQAERQQELIGQVFIDRDVRIQVTPCLARRPAATCSAFTPNWPKPVKSAVTCWLRTSIMTQLPGPAESVTSVTVPHDAGQPSFRTIVSHSRSPMCRGNFATNARTLVRVIFPRSSRSNPANRGDGSTRTANRPPPAG